MRAVNCAVIGLGNVGRNLLRVLEDKAERLRAQYGIAFRVVLVADSSGVAVAPEGFDAAQVRLMKEAGGKVRDLPGWQSGVSLPAAIRASSVALLFESSPVNLVDGEPAMSALHAALGARMHVVLANKAPLVLAYRDLHELAASKGVQIGFSATVCGALPVINIGTRDLVAADILSLRGIFNSTTNFILGEMQTGRSFDEALREAQDRGIAETDPTLDIDGWDTANKLVIIANSVLGIPATLQDVTVQGIRAITTEGLLQSQAAGYTIKLLASAERDTTSALGYRLTVAPTVMEQDDFFASCSSWEMGVAFHSDLYGRMYHKIWEREPLPTAAAMLRDAVNILTS